MKEKEGNNGEHKNEMNIRSMRVDNDCERSKSPQAAAIIGPSAPAINGGDSSARGRERGSEGGRREEGERERRRQERPAAAIIERDSSA